MANNKNNENSEVGALSNGMKKTVISNMKLVNSNWKLVIRMMAIIIALITIYYLPITSVVFAQEKPGPFTQELIEIIKRLNNWMLAILMVVTVTFIVYAAYLYLTAAGDAEKIKTANRVILYAVVAVAVALLALVFVAVVQQLVKPSSTTAPPSSEFIGRGGLRQVPPGWTE